MIDAFSTGEWVNEEVGIRSITAEERAVIRIKQSDESLAERQRKYKILIAKEANTKKGLYVYVREKPNFVSAGKIHHAPIHHKDYSLRPVIPNGDRIHVSGEESDDVVSVKTFGHVPKETIYVSKVTPVGPVYDPSKYDTDTDDLVVQA